MLLNPNGIRTSVEVPDAEVLKMVKRAEVTLELETGREIDKTRTT